MTPDALVADLTRDDLLALFYAMVLARAAEERLEVLFTQGHVKGGLYRSLGQEAGCVGAAYALRRRTDGTGDVLGQTIRATGAVFLFNGTPLEYFRQYLARATSPTAGREANVHWTDFQRGLLGPVSPLGTMVEIMAGITLSFRLTGQDRVGMVFYGDGASSTGAWHEGLNFAAAQACPMILMVEANQWAFSTPTRKQTRVQSFTEKGPGYGIAAEAVNGTDVVAVYQAVRRAADRARDGQGTSMVELRYFRRKGHAQHDPQDYVPVEDIAAWEARDPINQFRQRMLLEGWASEDELDALAERAVDVTREAAEAAVAEALPEGPEAVHDVYTDVTMPVPWTRSDAGRDRNTTLEER
jgi:pyruvate dehydrogenase E1 component alpha subunit/2-oxoisovalerate dehydrogenase E1 component alpha subunit